MGLIKEFRTFAMKGSVVDLAVGVIIGAAFGKIVTSLVEDILMPPIGRMIGGLDFSNLYISLSDRVDAENARLAAEAAAKSAAPATQNAEGITAAVSSFVPHGHLLALADAKKLGPVIAYGNFLTITINFIIVAFCIFLVIKLMNVAKARFEREQKAAADAAPSPLPADVQLLSEIRDLLKDRPRI